MSARQVFFLSEYPLDGVSSQTVAIDFEAPILRLFQAPPPGFYTKPLEQARVWTWLPEAVLY